MGARDEFAVIARHFAPLAKDAPGAFGLTNDAAVIAPDGARGLVTTIDTLVEGVHFLPDDPADLVARKLLRTNLSDLAAMGASPESYLLTMALDKARDESWIERFAAGLAADQASYGLVMLGGDTVSTPGPVTLSLAAFGRVPDGRVLERGTAEPGAFVYVTGTIGDGALGLLVRQGRLTGLPERERAFLETRYRLPEPRTALGPGLLDLATACLDISDGLVADLGHIAKTSGVGMEVRSADVPLSEAAGSVLADDPDCLPLILTGGDDYELAFTAAPENAEAIAALSRETGVPVACIGRTLEEPGVTVLDREGRRLELESPGWVHF
ncbi:thiamine-phosphate kinase [Algihabitans albus]|uniref:thiamine-phosphate kinase n=1 Tax=Algihabitans albus TaxID=2164067 RepID=UPI000E5CD37A|nr:thiamine-phosphate kinase [Algihabitans albus]